MIKITDNQLKQFMNKTTQTAKIIDPIRSFGIVGVFYLRIYPDGSILNLGSDANWVKYYFDMFKTGVYQSNDIMDQYFPQMGVNL